LAQIAEQAYHLPQHQDHSFVLQPSTWGGDRLVGATLYIDPASASAATNFTLQRQAADGTVVWQKEYDYGDIELLGHAEVNGSGSEIVAVGSAESVQLGVEKAFAVRIDATTGAVLGGTVWAPANNTDVRLLHVAYVPVGMNNQPMWVAAGWTGDDTSKSATKEGWVVAFSTTLSTLWQRGTNSPVDPSSVNDWDMTNHVLPVPGTGVMISGSCNGAAGDLIKDQAGLAWMIDVNGNLKWKHATHLATAPLNARMVTAGGHVQGSSIVQIANELGPQCFAIRQLNPATGAQISGYRVDVSGPSAAVPKAFDTQVRGTGFVLAGYLNDYTWTVTTPNGGFAKTENQPFHLMFTPAQTGGFPAPSGSFVVHRVDPVSGAGERVQNDFLSALRPTEQPYIFHPRMLELAADTGVVLMGWRDRYVPNSHDQEWIISNFAGTAGSCDPATLPVTTLSSNWEVKTGPSILDIFFAATNQIPTASDPFVELIPCGEIGYPACHPNYAATFVQDCDPRAATFTASPSGFPVTPPADMLFTWDFGDGTGGAGQTVSHTYAADGTYTVTLTLACVWDPTATVTSTVTVTFACNEPCLLPLVGPLGTEWIHSCGETPMLRAMGLLISPPTYVASGYCSGWEIDGVAVDGTGIAEFALTPGTHEVCRVVWCCDNPSDRRERCKEVEASVCPPIAGLDFTITSLTGAECAGCTKGLTIQTDGAALEDCQNLVWDFSWTSSEPLASPLMSVTTCVPPVPFGHRICLRQICPITGAVIQEVCKNVSCWYLALEYDFDLSFLLAGNWLVPEVSSGPCSLSVGIGPYEDLIVEQGFHGTFDGPFLTPFDGTDGAVGNTFTQYTLPPVDFPLVAVENGWAIADAATGFPVFEVPGALAIRDTDYGAESVTGDRLVEGFPASAVVVFNITTPLGLLQWTSGPYTFGCANSDACASDLNDDGFVTVTDLLFLLGTFGEACE